MGFDRERQTDNESVFSVVLLLESGAVTIPTKDILQLYFIEDIFSFCMTGKFVFNDVYGLVENGPFTGNEQIVLVYGKKEYRELAFDIWKIKDISQSAAGQTESQSLIELYLVDSTFELYTLKRFSRGFDTATITSIIEHIFNNMLGLDDDQLNIEQTSTEISNFCIPYWTPMETISWLMKRASGNDSEKSSYLCYNNTYNSFTANVVTLNYLLSDFNDTEEDLYHFNKKEYKNKIFEWWVSSLDKNATRVIRGGKWRGFDSSTKQPVTVEYDYSDGIDDANLLGRKSLFVDISDTTTNNTILGESNSSYLQNIVFDKWLRRYCMQQIVNVIVMGDEDRYAGKQIEIIWPSSEIDQRFNKMMKGFYLIKSITHMLTANGNNMTYNQRLVLIKNAYHEVDMRSLLKATNFRTS